MALKTIMMMTNNWFVENSVEDNYDDDKWEVPWLAEGGVTDLRNHRQQQTDHLLDKNSSKTLYGAENQYDHHAWSSCM